MRFSNALVNGILPDKQPWKVWNKHARVASRNIRAETDQLEETVPVDFSKFNPKKYLLSWATIVGGVEPEKNGYWINPSHSQWVNDNGNAWLNQVLLENYKSFIMAENYLEHIQIPALSKGKILDAVAWVVKSKGLPTVFVDILVATNKRKHPGLVNDILKGRINCLSMGCLITHSQCSRCGEIFEEDVDEPCIHILEQLGQEFPCKDGQSRITAELCGVAGDPGTVQFIEGSWVKTPAFSLAQKHDTLKIGGKWLGSPIKAYVPKSRLSEANPEG